MGSEFKGVMLAVMECIREISTLLVYDGCKGICSLIDSSLCGTDLSRLLMGIAQSNAFLC